MPAEDWVFMLGPKGGKTWLNKKTGKTTRIEPAVLNSEKRPTEVSEIENKKTTRKNSDTERHEIDKAHKAFSQLLVMAGTPFGKMSFDEMRSKFHGIILGKKKAVLAGILERFGFTTDGTRKNLEQKLWYVLDSQFNIQARVDVITIDAQESRPKR